MAVPILVCVLGLKAKTAIAVCQENQIFLSCDLGNLQTVATYERFWQTINSF